MKKIVILICVLFSAISYAGVREAAKYYLKSSRNTSYYPKVIEELIDDGYYYTAIPLIKEYLVSSRKIDSRKMDSLLDKVIKNVGVRQFEVLSKKILGRVNLPVIHYIYAKKLFRERKYSKSLKRLNATIPSNHYIKPFALMLEGSNYSLLGKTQSAIEAYKECIDKSNRFIGSNHKINEQLKINRDFCVIGIPRTYFNIGNYQKAHSMYLDLPKRSHIWPEILFEEAWTSFYLNDYNRALGKLVTYQAPVLTHIFNPEIDVLNALTYFELCLWDDVKQSVDRFYETYGNSYGKIRKFLKQHGRDYKYYYLLGKSVQIGKKRGNNVLNRMLKSITRDPSYVEMLHSFNRGKEELERSDQLESRSTRGFVKKNLREALFLERDLIGAYVRKNLYILTRELEKSLEGMSAIKLEVLSRKKKMIYSVADNMGRTRGNIKNLSRTSKQYFWNFNGEFWADELGDYVFSLKSRCEQ